MKFSDKLESVSTQATVYYYDHGYMVEVTGKPIKKKDSAEDDDWLTVRLAALDLETVFGFIKDIDSLKKIED